MDMKFHQHCLQFESHHKNVFTAYMYVGGEDSPPGHKMDVLPGEQLHTQVCLS